jgi:hypothetical protein
MSTQRTDTAKTSTHVHILNTRTHIYIRTSATHAHMHELLFVAFSSLQIWHAHLKHEWNENGM